MRNQIIKDFLFPTQLKVVNNKFTKYIKVERKLFKRWYSDARLTSNKDINRVMNIKLDRALLKLNCDYQFGYLLTANERKWLQNKLMNML